MTQKLQPHQIRVIEEQAELATRLEKLNAFLPTPVFANLDPTDKFLLKKQAEVMQTLSDILVQRINRF